VTGATADRPQLKKLLAQVGQGDVVIIPAVDRLSRDTTDLLIIARDLQKTGAGLRSLAEPVVDTTSDFAELVLAMLGVAAKLERRRIKERTARGRADAKANGVKFGRKPKLTPHQKREAIKRRDKDEETLRSIGRSYNVSAATISRLASRPPCTFAAPILPAICAAFTGSTSSPIYSGASCSRSNGGASAHRGA